MTIHDQQWVDATGKALYWFPDASLGTWLSNRVPAVERPAPDLGVYDALLDDSISADWYLFEGAAQPSDWDQSLASVQLRIPAGDSRAVNWTDAPARTLYWMPDVSLDEWLSQRVEAVERSAPDLGMYDAVLDRTLSTDWYLFEGNAQPSSWGDALTTLELLDSDCTEEPAAISPSGSISYSELLSRVGHYLFGKRSGFSYDQTQDIEDCIHDGLNRVYSAREWSFFRPLVDITTTAPYTAGTVEIASGVVTLSGGTFPSWAASGVLYVDSIHYSVSSRDSNTQITLDDTSITKSSSVYALARPEVSLGAAFDAVSNDSDLVYQSSGECWYPPVKWSHDSTIRKLERNNPEFNYPRLYSVRNVQFDPTVGSRKVLAFYPTPDAAYTLRVPLILRPINISLVNPYPIGGEMLRQVILEACLASAEHNFEEREHVHEKRFMEQIALAIRNDEDRSSPTSLGSDGSVVHNVHRRLIGRVSFDDLGIGAMQIGSDTFPFVVQ